MVQFSGLVPKEEMVRTVKDEEVLSEDLKFFSIFRVFQTKELEGGHLVTKILYICPAV